MDVRSVTSGTGTAEVKERARRTRSLEGSFTLKLKFRRNRIDRKNAKKI